MTKQAFIKMLLRRTKMSEVTLASSDYPPLIRYIWDEKATPVSLALSIKRNAFISHGSAMWIHGLGSDENLISINVEQSKKPPNRNVLTQEGIDRGIP